MTNQQVGNPLFPVYLQLNSLHTLLVGGGNVALEKLTAILGNSAQAPITLVASKVSDAVWDFVREFPTVSVEERNLEASDLDGKDVVVVASNNDRLNEWIRAEARKRHVLINVADKPALCDFYLGSVVKKGNLKIGISTNGKSPTIAKRLKELLQDALPEELDETLAYMHQLRERLKGDFAEKVRVLNAHTASLLASKNEQE